MLNNILFLLIILLISFYLYSYFKNKLNKKLPINGSEPIYNPDKWNNDKYIRYSHNCYSYFLDDISNRLRHICKKGDCRYINPQPGHFSGKINNIRRNEINCHNMLKRIKLDNPYIYDILPKKKCKKKYYKGALTVHPNRTYHFYRQNRNGYFSHKDGGLPVTNVDASGKKIKDVRYANRKYKRSNYKDFCGYMCVPNNKYIKTNMGRNDLNKTIYKV